MEMARMPTPGPNQSKPANGQLRIAALDGMRGFMTILVLFSHFFAEIPNGFPRLGFGWLAVNMFFVLSGFLIGRLIIERKDSENFFTVFIRYPFLTNRGPGWLSCSARGCGTAGHRSRHTD